MNHMPIDTSKDPVSIRLFESDFLEFFTHISPVTIVVLWVPVTVILLAVSITSNQGGGFPWYIPAAFVSGLFLWTLAEYTLHRFLFHYPAKTPRAERIFFLFHGIHHAQPQDKTRLVMPFPVSIPMALIFYGLFTLILGGLFKAGEWVNPMMAGFMSGYLAYDLTHYATHHFPMRRGYAKFIKRYHMAAPLQESQYQVRGQLAGLGSGVQDDGGVSPTPTIRRRFPRGDAPREGTVTMSRCRRDSRSPPGLLREWQLAPQEVCSAKAAPACPQILRCIGRETCNGFGERGLCVRLEWFEKGGSDQPERWRRATNW